MRWGPLIGTVSLLCCLNHLSSAPSTLIRSGFPNSFILHPFRSNALITLVPFFQIAWNAKSTRPYSRHRSAYFSPYSVCRVNLSFPSTLTPFLLFVTVAMLPLCRSPVNCKNRHIASNFTHKVNYCYCFHFPGLKFM